MSCLNFLNGSIYICIVERQNWRDSFCHWHIYLASLVCRLKYENRWEKGNTISESIGFPTSFLFISISTFFFSQYENGMDFKRGNHARCRCWWIIISTRLLLMHCLVNDSSLKFWKVEDAFWSLLRRGKRLFDEKRISTPTLYKFLSRMKQRLFYISMHSENNYTIWSLRKVGVR